MRQERCVSRWISLMFAVTAGIWCFVIPIGEAPDEREHLQYAQFIRENGRVPNRDDLTREYNAEAFQAPLYHTILAGLSTIIDFDPARITWIKNPVFDRTSFPGRANEFDQAATRAVNSPGDMLKFRIMRLPNVVFGALMIWILLRTVSALGSFGSGGLLVIIAASTPLITFSAGAIGNDLLTAFCCALAVFAMTRASVYGERAWIWIAALALALGLLVKVTVLFLWIPIVFVALWSKPRWRPTRERFILIVFPLLSAAWTLSRTLQFQGREPGSVFSLTSYVVTGVKTFYHCVSTAVGVLGVHSIWLPGFVYGVFLAIAAVVLFRWLRAARFDEAPQRLSLAGWSATLLSFLAAVYWYRDSGYSMHSRLFLPFVPAMLIGPAVAWRSASDHAAKFRPGLVIAGFVLLAASFLPENLWLSFAHAIRGQWSLVKPAEHYAASVSRLLSAMGAFLIVVTIVPKCLPALIRRVDARPSALVWMAAVGFAGNLLILFFHVRLFFT